MIGTHLDRVIPVAPQVKRLPRTVTAAGDEPVARPVPHFGTLALSERYAVAAVEHLAADAAADFDAREGRGIPAKIEGEATKPAADGVTCIQPSESASGQRRGRIEFFFLPKLGKRLRVVECRAVGAREGRHDW